MKKFLLIFIMLFLAGCKTTKEEIKELKTQINSLKENVVYKNEFQFEINVLKEKIKDLQKNLNKNTPIKENDEFKQELLLKISKLEEECKNLQNKMHDINFTIVKIKSKKLIKADANISVVKADVKKPKNNKNSLTKFFKPTVFITKNKTHIYNSNNKIIDTWCEHTTFTSYIKKGNKLRVTGYFVNRKFKNALNKDWWIKIDDVKEKFNDEKR